MVNRGAVLFLAAALVSGCSAAAPDPTPAPPSAGHPPHQAAGPQRIHITVSGPQDTLMRVVRAGTQSQVALQGEPFDFEFSEQAADIGDLGIAVFAKTDTPGDTPLQCSITVDGRTVAEESATKPGERGYAEVACSVPDAV